MLWSATVVTFLVVVVTPVVTVLVTVEAVAGVVVVVVTVVVVLVSPSVTVVGVIVVSVWSSPNTTDDSHYNHHINTADLLIMTIIVTITYGSNAMNLSRWYSVRIFFSEGIRSECSLRLKMCHQHRTATLTILMESVTRPND